MEGSLESDFGRYLPTVMERDIDLLLMEEFHISPSFVSWFAKQVGLNDIGFSGAWHSVADHDGETDLLLRVTNVTGARTAILIENKIAAVEQFQQDHRYHLRGIRSREAGRFDEYITCICAPSTYLKSLSSDSRYDKTIPYEDIRDWFAQSNDGRSVWRKGILAEAIEHGRRGYVMIVDAGKTAFQKSYWEYLKRHHPKIKMNDPKNKGPKSVWIVLKTHDMPPNVTLDHKIDRDILDLTFQRMNIDDILRIKNEWPDDITPIQVGKSTVLRKSVPRLDMNLSLSEQIIQFEEIISAAYKLSEYSDIAFTQGSD